MIKVPLVRDSILLVFNKLDNQRISARDFELPKTPFKRFFNILYFEFLVENQLKKTQKLIVKLWMILL